MRFGLVGTGHWARIAHAPALASTPGVSLAAVWGRNAGAARSLAAEHGAAGFSDVGAFLDAVDAVAFAVPPDVQAPLAIRAAEAGKHLLLEKPVALSVSDADKLVDAVDAAGVASVVFFTHQFNTEIRAWLADERARGADGGWSGGVAVWLGAALQPDSPFNTPWRQDKGGLWDLGPHVVAMLWACLGPVTSVTAVAGGADVTHLVLRHSGGASSAATVTLSAPAGGRGEQPVRLGRGRPLGHAGHAGRPGGRAARRGAGAGRQRRVRAAAPARRPLRPRRGQGAGRCAGTARGRAKRGTLTRRTPEHRLPFTRAGQVYSWGNAAPQERGSGWRFLADSPRAACGDGRPCAGRTCWSWRR